MQYCRLFYCEKTNMNMCCQSCANTECKDRCVNSPDKCKCEGNSFLRKHKCFAVVQKDNVKNKTVAETKNHKIYQELRRIVQKYNGTIEELPSDSSENIYLIKMKV